MVEVQQRTGGSVVALMEVPREAISAYGAAAIETVEGEDFVKVTGLVEKPEPEQAPSNYAVIGRYVLSPRIPPPAVAGKFSSLTPCRLLPWARAMEKACTVWCLRAVVLILVISSRI